MAAVLRRAGVPGARIGLECRSRNTWENAHLSAPILARWGVSEAVVVTSWFHMRRAMISFRAAAPGLRLYAGGTPAPESFIAAAATTEGVMAALEPLKLAWYGLHYRAPVFSSVGG